MSGMSDRDYENRRATQRLHEDMQLIERQRQRAQACDRLALRMERSESKKVQFDPIGRIIAWFRPSHYSGEDRQEMQLTHEEVRELREWLEDKAHKLREHADSIERKRAGVGGA